MRELTNTNVSHFVYGENDSFLASSFGFSFLFEFLMILEVSDSLPYNIVNLEGINLRRSIGDGEVNGIVKTLIIKVEKFP